MIILYSLMPTADLPMKIVEHGQILAVHTYHGPSTNYAVPSTNCIHGPPQTIYIQLMVRYLQVCEPFCYNRGIFCNWVQAKCWSKRTTQMATYSQQKVVFQTAVVPKYVIDTIPCRQSCTCTRIGCGSVVKCIHWINTCIVKHTKGCVCCYRRGCRWTHIHLAPPSPNNITA